MNAVSPLNAYFGLIVAFAMKYESEAGVGTVIALMLLTSSPCSSCGRSCLRCGTSSVFHGEFDPGWS